LLKLLSSRIFILSTFLFLFYSLSGHAEGSALNSSSAGGISCLHIFTGTGKGSAGNIERSALLVTDKSKFNPVTKKVPGLYPGSDFINLVMGDISFLVESLKPLS